MRNCAIFAVVRCPSVGLSVCLSRSCIVSRRLKISTNSFPGLVADHFRFFDSVRRYPISSGTPSPGALNVWGEKILRFSTVIPFITETVRDSSMLASNVYKSQVADRSVSVSMTLSDL